MRISDWSSDVCSSDLHINQRLMHIRRKIGCIATHIDMCDIFQPIEQLTAAFPHALLHIDFFRAIERESDIHTGKHPVLQPGLPFALIQEISAEIAFPAEKPAFPACPSHFTTPGADTERS